MKREEYQRIRADVAKKYKEEIHVLKMKNQKLLHENINLRTQLYEERKPRERRIQNAPLYEIFERYLNAV